MRRPRSRLYVHAGGQPAHGAAWDGVGANALCHDVFRATRATLEGAWLRPRYHGYLAFQQCAGRAITRFLAGSAPASATLGALEAAFEASLAAKAAA